MSNTSAVNRELGDEGRKAASRQLGNLRLGGYTQSLNHLIAESPKVNKGGNNTMSKLVKKFAGLLGVGMMVVGMMALVSQKAFAVVNTSTNNAAGLTVYITPNVDRGVEISSGPGGFLQLGGMEMNTSTYTVRPATVTIAGNMTNTELTLGATIQDDDGASGNGTNYSWNFDNNPADGNADLMAVWVLFSSASVGAGEAVIPSDDQFEIANATITTQMDTVGGTPVDVGDNGALGSGNGCFEAVQPQSDMDALAPQTLRRMWVKVRTPSSTSISDAQRIVFTLTSEAGDNSTCR